MADENLCEYKKGEYLFEEGESSKDLYIVQKGIVKIFKRVDGKVLPLALVHSGQFIGELAFFDGKARSATAQAATDTICIKLDADKIEKELRKLPSWMLVMIKSLASRMREADDVIKRNRIVDQKMKDEFIKWDRETKS